MDQESERIMDAIRSVLKRNEYVLSASLFGSFSRGTATKDSDIDLLVEFKKGMSLFKLSRLSSEIENAVHRKVSISTPDSLHYYVKQRISDDLIRLL